ncbi:MAG: hypothetical protein ACR2OU_19880 [Thermomicrobiales bacterium]
MAITLSAKQQSYVEDIMREGSFESEEIAIDEALLRFLQVERRNVRIRELTEEGLESIRLHGTREGGEALKARLDKAIRKGLAEGRKPSDHIIHGI